MKKLFYLLLALPLVFAACEPEGKPNETPEPSNGIEFEAEMIVGDYRANHYTDIFNYYICLTNYGFSADGYPYASGVYYMLDIYGVEPEIDAEGFLTIPAGTYNFELEPTFGNKWTIANNEYSMYFAVNEDGTDYLGMGTYESATLVVTASGLTLTAVIGGQTHTVTYSGTPSFFACAPVEDDEVEAKYLDVYYYGTEYSATYNMDIYLSDLGFDAGGYAMAGGKYYELAIYTDVEPSIVDGYVVVPSGTYTFDATDSTAAWSISNKYSNYFVLNSAGTAYEAEAKYDDAVLVVTSSGMTLTATIRGAEHVVTYAGAPESYLVETRAMTAKAPFVKVEKRAMFVE